MKNDKNMEIPGTEGRRIEALERRLRRTWLGMGLVALACLTIAARPAFQSDAERLKVTGLQVVDETGRVLIELTTDEHGGVLRTRRPDGRTGVELRQYQVDAIEPQMTAGLVQVYGDGDESLVSIGVGSDRGGPVSMGADYNGGAIVVYRHGQPRHLTRPAVTKDGGR